MTKDRLNQLRVGSSKKTRTPPTVYENDDSEENEMTALTGQLSQPTIVKSKNKEKNELENAFKHVNSINEYLTKIKEDIIQLKRYHVRMQQSTRTDASLREQIDSLNECLKNNSMKIKDHLKELDKERKGNEANVIFRVVKTQHSVLSKRFQEQMLDYEETLAAHKKICEDLLLKQLHIVIEKYLLRKVTCVPAEKEVTDEELSAMLDADDTAVFVDNFTKETLEARQSLEDARDRHKEILVLEKQIAFIRDMFFDIAVHITHQGELIDRIEYHIGHGWEMTEKGSRKLNKAEKFMMKARKKKFCLVVVLAAIIIILLLIIAFQFGS